MLQLSNNIGTIRKEVTHFTKLCHWSSHRRLLFVTLDLTLEGFLILTYKGVTQGIPINHAPSLSLIQVYIAQLKLNPTNAVFLPAISFTTVAPVAPPLPGGSIAAIVVGTLVSIIIVVTLVTVWYRNRKASRKAALTSKSPRLLQGKQMV